MDSSVIYATIIYLALFRLAVIGTGAMGMYLGYRLFVQGVFAPPGGEGAGLEAELGGTRFTLKNAAPGTFFALFGVIVISVMIINSPPELSYSKNNQPGPTEAETGVGQAPARRTEEFALRGAEPSEADKALARKLNNRAFDFLDAGQPMIATMAARLADYVDPDNPMIWDTLAEMLYAEQSFSEALKYKKKAAAADPEKFAAGLAQFESAAAD